MILFNGEKGEFFSQLTAVENNIVQVYISSFTEKDVESPLKINLAQGISRGEKMDYAIQKSVELGVHSIIPLFTRYSNLKLTGTRLTSKIQHWQKIAIHACEQSGRCFIPKIEQPLAFGDWISQAAGKKIILDPKAESTLADNLENVKPNEVTLLIGAEGGFSDEELIMAENNGFARVQLGPRILRTETAPLVALSILQHRLGDL